MSTFNKRQFSRGEKQHPMIRGQAERRYRFIRLGEILFVDPDRYRLKIRWISGGDGSPDWIPIPFPYASPSGCIGTLPEPHAYVLCGFFSSGLDSASPVLLGYIPANLLAGLDFSDVKDLPDALPNEDENIIKYRFRDLAEGDMIVKSILGSHAMFNKTVLLRDLLGDSFTIRYQDQAIVAASVNNYLYADGVMIQAGPAQRKGMNLLDSGGVKIQGTNGSLKTLPNLEETIYIVPFGQDIQYSSKYYSEYRIDVDEICDAMLDQAESSTSIRDPIVALSLGNYIDADRRTTRYGTILRPTLFSTSRDMEGAFNLVQAVQNKGTDEVSTLGLAYALHFLKSGTFIGIDKEGHHYMYLTASRANPLGAGRSMSTLAMGNLKEIWGASADTNNAWDLSAKGGISWQVGNHNSLGRGRSIDIRTSSGIFLEVNGNDEDGWAKQEMLYGDVYEHTKGDHNREVVGTDNLIVSGLKSELIMGAAMYVFEADKAENVAGQSSEIVTKEKQCRFGSRKTTISNGNDTLDIIKGNLEETLTLGTRKTSVTTGVGGIAISEEILSGKRQTTIVQGDYNVSVTAGNISLSTLSGNATLSSSLNLELSAKAQTTLKGLTVNIGNGPLTSGLVSGAGKMPSHFDYTTGAPLKGLSTVMAGP